MARKPGPDGPDTPIIDDDLVRPGGKVDPAAVFRAARAMAAGRVDAEIRARDESEDPDGELPSARVTFRLSRDLRKRLDKYLTDRITFMSRAQLQRLIEAGGVTVNGRAAKSSTVLCLHDVIEIEIPAPPAEDVPPEDIPLDVMFEDEHLIVLNKSPDIIVHPARSHLSGTLINALAHHFGHRSSGSLSSVGKEFARPGVVHRLDRQTSGVIVFAKTDEAHWRLARQFELRQVDKRYFAVAHGRVEPAADVIDRPIGPHPSREKGHREKHVVRHDELGKPSVTIYRVLARYGPRGDGAGEAGRAGPSASEHAGPVAPQSAPRLPSGWGGSSPHSARVPVPRVAAAQPARDSGEFTAMELELKTGRTHQIRVHLSHLGFPLVGDDMYGGRALRWRGGGRVKSEEAFERQALHAALLVFRHPISGRDMSFAAPLPSDLRGLLRYMRGLGRAEEEPRPSGAVLDLTTLACERSPSGAGGESRPSRRV
ncbi:MAG: RluA family pseudouridine synthase [Phycisphaerae bacterium]|nr:RluA family pseudouridine synthase [Phycisphaerae bacterium]